jgi:transcriptional regulator with XRE-family HTH domain
VKTSEAWVELAIKSLNCNQKELARMLAVSETQVSKWKGGDYISMDMDAKFRKLLKLDDDHQYPEFMLWAGSLENGAKWDQLIRRLAKEAKRGELWDTTDPFVDDYGLRARVVEALAGMGIEPPKAFPEELAAFVSDESDRSDDDLEREAEQARVAERLEANPYSRTILAILKSAVCVGAFYAAYVEELFQEEAPTELFEKKMEFEEGIIQLAAAKIKGVDKKFAPKFREFRYEVLSKYEGWLSKVKERAFREGKPLRAELMDLVRRDKEELVDAVEGELADNSVWLHPDIYMNELLVGMRVLHQVLPAIMAALQIDLVLDHSKLALPRPLWDPWIKPSARNTR